MKKFSLIYAISFLPYLAHEVCSFLNNNTDKLQNSLGTLVSVLLFSMIPAVIYQLIYIIWLGRKDKVSVIKSIGRFFLYFLLSKSITIIISYISIYSNGFVEEDFLDVYYGAEALSCFSKSVDFYPTQFIFLTFLYCFAYFFINRLHQQWIDHITKEYEELTSDDDTDE
ncbi:MAG: hypothetical protein HDT44_01265 [Ruminococcaceae bacterium]|nr:hypothetical protein [Oscillospiraceae bacterium]